VVSHGFAMEWLEAYSRLRWASLWHIFHASVRLSSAYRDVSMRCGYWYSVCGKE